MRRLIISLLAISVALSLLAAGWFSARYYYTLRHRDGPQAQGEFCDPGKEQVTALVPSGPLTLSCSITKEEVIEQLGPPYLESSMKTEGQTIEGLVYHYPVEEEQTKSLLVTFVDGQLWSAFATEGARGRIPNLKRRPPKESREHE